MPEETKTEPAGMLKAFERKEGEASANPIRYPNLDQAAAEAKAKEMKLLAEFWESEEGSIGEEERARAAAIGYFVLTGQQLQIAAERFLPEISERFTQASIELYGEPEADESHRILSEQYQEFADLRGNERVDQQQLELLLSTLEMYQPNRIGTGPESSSHREVQRAVKEYLETNFGEALAIFNELPEGQTFNGQEAAELFTKARSILAQQEPDWLNWKETLTDKKSMSTDKKTQTFLIGANGQYSTQRLRGLFAHEVLGHGLRALNGAKTGNTLLQTGLPGYLDTEEGIAKLLQVSLTGEEGDKFKDFYLDTALALGTLGLSLKREEILKLHTLKEKIRQQAAEEVVDPAKFEDDSWRYVNRIYRGSLGNEHIAVNTKDIAYYKGYVAINKYIAAELEQGRSIEEIMDYILSGSFDPTNSRHIDYRSQFADV
jgi:hypothetical protein